MSEGVVAASLVPLTIPANIFYETVTVKTALPQQSFTHRVSALPLVVRMGLALPFSGFNCWGYALLDFPKIDILNFSGRSPIALTVS
jgi:hypothetical protein